MAAPGDPSEAPSAGVGVPSLNLPRNTPGWRWGHWGAWQDPLLWAGPSIGCLSMGLQILAPDPHPLASPQLDWRQVLVLGLDGAGKSSVLHYICSQTARERIAPTHGFNSAQLYVEGLEMDLLEGKPGHIPQG